MLIAFKLFTRITKPPDEIENTFIYFLLLHVFLQKIKLDYTIPRYYLSDLIKYYLCSLLNTQYMRNSTIVYLEFVTKVTILGLN